MEDGQTSRMHKYGESKTTWIMMASVRHVTSSSGTWKISGRWIFVGLSVRMHVYSHTRSISLFPLRISTTRILANYPLTCRPNVACCQVDYPPFWHYNCIPDDGRFRPKHVSKVSYIYTHTHTHTYVDTVHVRLLRTFMMVVMNERKYVQSFVTNVTWPVQWNMIRIFLLLLY